MIDKIAAVVAELDPEMAANRPHAPMVAMARLPRSQPSAE